VSYTDSDWVMSGISDRPPAFGSQIVSDLCFSHTRCTALLSVVTV